MENLTGGVKRPRAAEAPRFFSIFQKRSRSSARSKPEQKPSADSTSDGDVTASRQIFCDLDGVLVDFDAGVTQLQNAHYAKPGRKPAFHMWKAIRQAPHFYRTLPWTADGKELWTAIAPLRPHILTGVPWSQDASRDKFEWCQQELTLPQPIPWKWRNMLGPKKTHVRANLHMAEASLTAETSSASDASSMPPTNGDSTMRCAPTVITCWSLNKPLECRSAGDVLIDDRPEAYDLRIRWEQAGGVFIHHTSARETIRALVEMGLLSQRSENNEERDVVEDPGEPTSVNSKC
jgi:hypothetical protein